MAEKKKPSTKKKDKVFDVAKPGKGAVDIGSKPMIVGHKTMASDPMMRDQEADGQDDKAEDMPIQTSKVKIEPLSKDLKSSEASEEESKEPPAEEDTPKEGPKDSPKTEQKPAADETSSDDKATDDNSSAAKDKKEAEKTDELDPAAIEMERQERLQNIIDSKKYRLNIKETSSYAMPMRMKVVTVVAIVVVLVVSVFFAIDSGMLDLGFELPFSIIGE